MAKQINKQVVGNRDGNTSTLIQIDEVEEHVPDGTYKTFMRVLVHNPKQEVTDSFYFDTDDDFKLDRNFLITNENTMELLTMFQMAISERYDLDKFLIELVKKMKADFGYENLRMVGNKKGA